MHENGFVEILSGSQAVLKDLKTVKFDSEMVLGRLQPQEDVIISGTSQHHFEMGD